ncbi:unnamed protein product [Zymoseptoria tritici ST99CH_1A5]|uniref:ESCRT-II complex subunit VPS25 n=4 Tax=Zymoseptoria tritici TaxID=1047171 RepID=A0A1X7RHK8_ZYMT9|nr:unnamed protein product [Zymoseptoria tritici ST99CH_3D7]SMR43248.1 unnamed protein product [Zymoseptoria tritici ST99CH_1E4]SMR45409.1 unnamed protein product [Zymoseptoria tritici ST99CH_3D1]SMY20568.1 unnamed protein product [Zymoseptoria tritici ST99CH_1A5]
MAEQSLAGLSISGPSMASEQKPVDSGAPDTTDFASIKKYPPFYTLQPNLTTRARQLELWSSIITSYCAQQRIFRLSLSSPPADLFGNASIKRSLKSADVRTVLDYMSKPENGPRIEWIPSTGRGEQSSTCYIYWKTPAEWADTIYSWIDDTGQKGTVLTIYELREGDAVQGKEWKDIDETLLRKVLAVLVKRGKGQIFGQEESAGIKFF